MSRSRLVSRLCLKAVVVVGILLVGSVATLAASDSTVGEAAETESEATHSEALSAETLPAETLPEVSTAPSATRPTHDIPQIDGAMTIDGQLDEAAWQQALMLTLDFETDPGENVAAEVRTECYLMYDQRRLYVAFKAFDPEPEKIRARLTDRDTAFRDDFLGVALDTFNDERHAFEFFVNPLGIQMDLIFDDVNSSEDESWNGLWKSSGRLTDFGYQVEFAIPFSTLRFPRTSGVQTWGIDVLRKRPRNFSQRLAINPLAREVNCYLCQFSKIRGFEGISPGRNIELNPTLTSARFDRRADDDPNGPLVEGDGTTDLGLTVSWGISPNMTLSGTLQPDFSQVEADTAQLDINNRFALFFSERRPFFLESAELFSSPLDIVFTRNVAAPKWGTKLTGKQGKHAIGLFVAEDEQTNLLFPGSQGSDAGRFDFATTDSVVRYRHDIGSSSAVGLLATQRQGSGYSNEVAGIDGRFRIGSSHSISIQGLTSSTQYPIAVAEEFEQPEDSFDGTALRVAYEYEGREWIAYSTYEDLDDGFRADMGFVPQVDYRFLLAGLKRLWWGSDDTWYSRLELGGDWNRSEDQAGQLLEEESEIWGSLSGPKQLYVNLNVGTREQAFDGVVFDQDYFNSYFEISPSGSFYVTLRANFGDEIDFANVRPGRAIRWAPSIRWELGRHLRTVLSHDYRHLDVDGGRLFEANLTQLRWVYQLNRRTFVRLISQLTDIERDTDLYVDEVDSETRRWFNQLLFSYKLNPRTVLFLGYSDGYEGDERIDLRQENRALFFKVGYAWVL